MTSKGFLTDTDTDFTDKEFEEARARIRGRGRVCDDLTSTEMQKRLEGLVGIDADALDKIGTIADLLSEITNKGFSMKGTALVYLSTSGTATQLAELLHVSVCDVGQILTERRLSPYMEIHALQSYLYGTVRCRSWTA